MMNFIRWCKTHWLLVIASSAIAFFTFSLSVYQINSQDVFSNIVSGQWIWEHKALPAADPFSYTGPWKWNYIWPLSLLCIYGSYHLAGLAGVETFYAVLTALSFLIPFWFFSKKRAFLNFTYLFTVLTIGASSIFFAPRKFIFGHVLQVLFLTILMQRNKKILWLLPLLQIIWTNTYSGSVIGIVLLGIWWATEVVPIFLSAVRSHAKITKKTLYRCLFPTAIFGSTVVANFISPNTPHYISMLRDLGMWSLLPSQAFIVEWFPVTHTVILYSTLARWFFSLAALFFLFSIWALFQKQSKQFFFLLATTACFFAISVRSNRYIPVFYLNSLFFLCTVFPTLSATNRYVRQITAAAGKTGVSLGLIILSVAAGLWISFHGYWIDDEYRPSGVGVDEIFSPSLIRSFRTLHTGGNVFYHFNSSSYGLFMLYPAYKTYFDAGRLNKVYPDSFFADYLRMINTAGDFRLLTREIKKYDIRTFIIETPQFGVRTHAFVNYFANSPDWVLFDFDDYLMIYIKRAETKRLGISAFSVLKPYAPIGNLLKKNPALSQQIQEDFAHADKTGNRSYLLIEMKAAYYYASGNLVKLNGLLDTLKKRCETDIRRHSCYQRLLYQYNLTNQFTRAHELLPKLKDTSMLSYIDYGLIGDVERLNGHETEAIAAYQMAGQRAYLEADKQFFLDLLPVQ